MESQKYLVILKEGRGKKKGNEEQMREKRNK